MPASSSSGNIKAIDSPQLWEQVNPQSRNGKGSKAAQQNAGTAPNSAAVNPDSNSPSWLDLPMKSEFTALTRPRMASGVRSCTNEKRTTTLGEAYQAECQGGAGQRIDLPADHHALHHEAER
jgi:hypothetical protein